MADINLIKFVEMSSDEKCVLAHKMASANVITLSYMDQIKSKINSKFSMEKFRSIFLKADPNTNLIVHDVVIYSNDLKKMQSVKQIEAEALSSVANLIISLAKKYSFNKKTQLEFEDYYNEAVLSTINAIYSYVRTDIAFTTFVQTAIANKFSNINNANRFTSPVSQGTRSNLKEYNKIKAENENFSFDEIVAQMDLNEREVNSLKSIFVSFTPVSQIGNDDEDILLTKVDEKVNSVVFDEFEKLVTNTEMNDWERTVLNAFLNGKDHGWASEVASKHINPETNAPYSRRAPRLALDRVLSKMKTQFDFSEFEEAA